MSALEKLNVYNIYEQIVNTKDHGIPQNRERWYVVGIAKEFDDGKFKFPEPRQLPDTNEFLDYQARGETSTQDKQGGSAQSPAATLSNARKNVERLTAELRSQGKDPDKNTFIFNHIFHRCWFHFATPGRL